MEEETLPPPTLNDLRGLHIPDEIPATPQTLGWLLLLILVGLALLVVAVLSWRRWRARRYRREAQAELQRLAARVDEAAGREAIRRDLPALVKRVALAAWPREAVADLSEQAWLEFLDRSQGGQAFTQGKGRLLPSLAYDAEDPTAQDLKDLMAVVSTWIDKHHVRA